MRLFLLALVLTVIGCSSAPKDLNDAEIRALLVGKWAIYPEVGVAHYEADGRYSIARTSGGELVGKWEIEANQLCVDLDDGRRRCDRFRRTSNGWEIVTGSGSGRAYKFTTSATPVSASFDPRSYESIPLIRVVPNPQLSAEEVGRRCLSLFANAEYEGKRAVQDSKGQIYVISSFLKFTSAGNVTTKNLADSRPVCVVRVTWTQHGDVTDSNFDGVQIIRYSVVPGGGYIYTPQEDGSLLFSAWYVDEANLKSGISGKAWGTFRRVK